MKSVFSSDNDTLIHFFLPTFNLSVSLPLNHHITSLQKYKIDDLRVMRVMN